MTAFTTDPSGLSFQLNGRGDSEARRLVRNHRLWEIYLLNYADVAPARVDRDADLIEHVLDQRLVDELEDLLDEKARERLVPGNPEKTCHDLDRTRHLDRSHRSLDGYGLRGAGRLSPAQQAKHAWRCYQPRGAPGLGNRVSCLRLAGFISDATWCSSRRALHGGCEWSDRAAWTRRDRSLLGVVFCSLFALGLILIRIAADHVDLDPGCVLYGALELAVIDSAAVPRIVWQSTAILLLNLTLAAVFFKELQLAAFDPRFASASGISPGNPSRAHSRYRTDHGCRF